MVFNCVWSVSRCVVNCAFVTVVLSVRRMMSGVAPSTALHCPQCARN